MRVVSAMPVKEIMSVPGTEHRSQLPSLSLLSTRLCSCSEKEAPRFVCPVLLCKSYTQMKRAGVPTGSNARWRHRSAKVMSAGKGLKARPGDREEGTAIGTAQGEKGGPGAFL